MGRTLQRRGTWVLPALISMLVASGVSMCQADVWRGPALALAVTDSDGVRPGDATAGDIAANQTFGERDVKLDEPERFDGFTLGDPAAAPGAPAARVVHDLILVGLGGLLTLILGWLAVRPAINRRSAQAVEARTRDPRAAQARLDMILAVTTDAVIVVDRDWTIELVNQCAADAAGERAVAGMNLFDAFPDTDHGEGRDQLRRAMADRKPVTFEIYCSRRKTWHRLNAQASEHGLIVCIRDITEHKDAVEASRSIAEQLQQSQKMEAVGQLTGGIAHDFNNLLTVISANLELMDGAADRAKIRRLAASARRAADRGARLTAQLLAFSRQQRLNPKPIDANRLMRDFHTLVRQAVGEGWEVRLMADEPLWPCLVDPAQLQAAVLNLVLNARDAMPDGGMLDIETRNIAVGEGAECPPGSYVRLSVKDHGSGMAPDILDRVFEPFFTTKEVGKGTGLGLSMVHGFVRQSGGHVAIDSVVGAGTTVCLYLPKTAQRPDAAADGVQAEAVPEGSERILLVEDDTALLQVTSEVLTDLGYEVSSAQSGAEAIRILTDDRKFDLLLSDVVMPHGANGVDLAREARRLNKSIKILLTSGYAMDVLQRHRAADEFAVIGKPFHRGELAQRLRSVLHAR